MPPRRLIVATANPGKLREFRALLGGLAFDLHSLGESGIESPEETGATFLENALLKARHAASIIAGLNDGLGAAAIADDSGLEVDALGGEPGIFSARYAGANADDAANTTRLLAALEGVAPAQRSARYRCVLVFVDGPDDPAPLVAEGLWQGIILETGQGMGGFGYDPVFFIPDLGMTAAQLEPSIKNALSHRGQAMRALRDQLALRYSQASDA